MLLYDASELYRQYALYQLCSRNTLLLKYRNRDMTGYLTRRRYTAFKDAYLWYMESVK